MPSRLLIRLLRRLSICPLLLASPAAAADGVIAGVVLDAEGQPIEGVLVDAWTWYQRNGNQARTDADGKFRLTNLQPGDTQVQFSKEGYCPRHFAAHKAIDTEAATNGAGPAGGEPWVVVMRNDTYLEGRVLDPKGAPVAGARVRARRGPFRNSSVVIGEVWTETDSDDDGRYRLYLEPDAYEVLVRQPGVGVLRTDKLKVVPGEQRTLDLPMIAGATFRANLVNSVTGEPLEGIRLFNWQQKGIEGVSDAAGVLTIAGMSPGPFTFQPAPPNRRPRDVVGDYARWWSPQATKPHQRKSIEPSQFQRNFDDLEFDIREGMGGVTIFFEPCVTIRGVVTSPTGLPVQGVTVAPAKTGSGNSITGDTRFSRRTNKKGRFTLKLPASGAQRYNLVAHDGGYGEWRGLANGVAEPIQTTPGQVIEGVQLRLNDPATATGRVVDAKGQPVAGKRVRAAPTDGLSHRYYLPEAMTDSQGRFTLNHLRPGEHLVQAEPFWLHASDAPSGSSTKINVEAGGEAEAIEVTASPPAATPFYGRP